MKIRIEKKRMINHLNNVSKALSNNTFLKSLQGLKIIASESNVKLIASNGNLSIKEIIEQGNDVDIIEPGVILVPGKLIINVIKQQQDMVEIFSTNDETLIVKSKGFDTNINLLNLSDYPQIYFETHGEEFVVDANKFRDFIDDVSYAAAEIDNSKKILTGVNLNSFKGKLRSTATNSFRLATTTMEINSNIDFNATIISNNLKNFIPTNAEDKLSISVDEQKIVTKHNTTTIMTNLLENSYPNISSYIPTEFTSKLTIDKNELNNLIDKALVVSDENNKTIKFTLSEDEFKIESKRKEVGDSIVISDSFEFSGDSIQIMFNATYLKNSLSRLSGVISLNFTKSDSGFTVTSNKKESLIQMILPQRSY